MESDLKPTFQKGFAMNANFVNQLAKHSSSVSEQTKVFAGLKYRKVLLMFRTNQIGENTSPICETTQITHIVLKWYARAISALNHLKSKTF